MKTMQTTKAPYAGEPSKSALHKVAGKIRLSNEGTTTDPCAGDYTDGITANICWCNCSCTCETTCSCSCSCDCTCICACSCDCSCICACSAYRSDDSCAPPVDCACAPPVDCSCAPPADGSDSIERRVGKLEPALQARFGDIGIILNQIAKTSGV